MTDINERALRDLPSLRDRAEKLVDLSEIVNEHLKLGREAELERIRNDYIHRFEQT